MSSILTIALYALGAYVLLRAVQLALMLKMVLGLRYHTDPSRRCEEAEVPDHLRAVLERVDGWRRLGFEPAGWMMDGARRPPAYGSPPCVRLLARGDGTWLELSVFAEAERGLDQVACIVSRVEGGPRVETWDAQQVESLNRGLPASREIRAAEVASPERLLELHEQALASRPVTAMDVDGAIADHDAAATAFVTHASELGLVKRGSDSEGWAYTLGEALRIAWKAVRLMPAVTKARTARRALGASSPEVPIEVEVDAWARRDERSAQRMPRALMWVIFGITALLFVASFSSGGAWAWAGSLAIVVLFHELGHWAAMRLRGYADSSIFFIPFFGGATVGHKPHASLTDEMIVLLAGPVPGLALGGALLFVPEGIPMRSAIVELAFLAIGVNALNLLPVFPLDGGRIAHRLVARGRPLVELALRVFGALALLGLAAWDGSILLGSLAALLLLGLRAAWHLSTAERTLRRHAASGEPRTRRAAILEHLRQARPDARLGARLTQAAALAARLESPDASMAAHVAWLVVYVGVVTVMVGPLLLLLAFSALT